MIDPSRENDLTILNEYSRPIVHLRREYPEGRLSLVFGAGVSKGFCLPDWKELVDKIGNHAEVKGLPTEKLKESLAGRVEILHRYFCDSQCKKAKNGEPVNDMEIRGRWFEILRSLIYEKVPKEEDLTTTHPYIGEYLKIIIGSRVTITYNFDSCIEMCLDFWAKENRPKRQRVYETIFPDLLPTRTRGSIYHINGYLPKNPLDVYSEELVFTEKQYADQFLETTTGRFATLAHYFATNTCLFIGISLADENIRYLLRRSAMNHPGHYHYFVRYHPPGQRDEEGLEKVIADYYFDTYNLITLFLDDVGIKSLGKLITCEFEELKRMAKGKSLKWVYYITGVMSSGKTSVRRSLRGLILYPEWRTQAPQIMGKPYNSLPEAETEEVDGWVSDQFKRKNERLALETEGIIVVDRAPLDPLSFTKEKDLEKKTKHYWDTIAPNYGKPLEPGSIILLTGDPQEIHFRLTRKTGSTTYSAEDLEKMQRNLEEIYKDKNTQIIDTRHMTLDQVVKKVAHVIHGEEYKAITLSRKSSDD